MDSGPWGDEKPTPAAAPWMDQGLAPSSWQGGPKHKPAWDGSDLDPTSWVHSKQVCFTPYHYTLLKFLNLTHRVFKSYHLQTL